MAEQGVDEVIITRIILDAKDAIAQARDWRAAVDAMKQELKILASEGKMSLDDVAVGFKKTDEYVTQTAEDMSRANKVVSQALREVKGETEESTGKFSKFAAAAREAIGGLLLFIATMRKVIQTLGEWVTQGIELSQTMFKVGASVRALQRTGIDITFKETLQLIRETREEFKFFSEKEVADGIAQIQLLTRNFKFSTDQQREMLDVATKLAVVQGKDVGETAKSLALFYSSGYAEALQRAGFAVNKLTIEEQAHREGLNKSFRQLSEVERAHIAHNLVLKQSASLTGELEKYQETLAGRYEIASASIDTSTARIGKTFAFLKVEFLELKARILEGLQKAADAWIKLDVLITASSAGIAKVIEVWGQHGKVTADTFWDAFNEAFEARAKQVDIWPTDQDVPVIPQIEEVDPATIEAYDNFREELSKAYRDLARELADSAKDLKRDLGDIVSTTQEGLAVVDEQGFAERLILFEDFNNQYAGLGEGNQDRIWDIEAQTIDGLGEIDEDGLRELAEIWYDYYEKLDDIARKLGQAIEDEEVDLQNDLADLAIQTQQKKEDARRKYQEDELRAERDFQEKLLRLQEKFLFDLEEALHERDARQVLRLIRRFELEKRQLEREKENEDTDREERLRRELEDIERQAQRKAEQLQIEHARRLQELELQAQREREQAERNRERAFEELIQDLERERQERVEKYGEELEDIRETFETKIADIIEKNFGDLDVATDELATSVLSTLTGAFGPGGTASKVFDALGVSIQSAVDVAIANIQRLQQLRDSVLGATPYVPDYNVNPELKNIPGFAKGGSMIARKPTVAVFGEAGAEQAVFTPLSALSSMPGPGSINVSGGVGGGNLDGKAVISVLLAPGLVGEIVDKSLEESGKILLEVIGG